VRCYYNESLTTKRILKMPELPEVETVKNGMAAVLNGETVAAVDLYRPDLRVPFPENLHDFMKGRRITALKRRAKYILMVLDDRNVFILHLGMSGRVLLLGAGQEYERQKHDHLILSTDSGVRMVYNDARRFGMVYFCHEDALDAHPAFATMGPEPLGNHFSGEVLYQALKKRKTPIKVALLDQKLVVGVGNIYASEALYKARIRPTRRADSITKRESDTLYSAIIAVLNAAIAAGGSTLRDHRQADGSLGYFQHNFAVYDRGGQACPDCDCDVTMTSGIKKITQGSRSTYYCPGRQV